MHILVTIVGIHYLPWKSMHFEFLATIPSRSAGITFGPLMLLLCVYQRLRHPRWNNSRELTYTAPAVTPGYRFYFSARFPKQGTPQLSLNLYLCLKLTVCPVHNTGCLLVWNCLVWVSPISCSRRVTFPSVVWSNFINRKHSCFNYADDETFSSTSHLKFDFNLCS